MTVRRKLALIGSRGMLATAVRRRAGAAWEIAELDLPEFDLTNRVLADSLLGRLHPYVIVNCAAYTNVDGAETEESLAMRVNGESPGHLAQIARQLGSILVHVSTDYVFDGQKGAPYREDDPVAPMSAYGRTKLAGERAIVGSGLTSYYIVRTSWLYGPNGKNFVETIIRLAMEKEELRIVADQVGSPTYTGDLAEAIFNLVALNDSSLSLLPKPWGIYHFANEGHCSWHEFACAIIAVAREQGLPIKTRRVLPIRTDEYPLPAQRPAYSVFSKDKYRMTTGASVPDWKSSLWQYMQERIA